MCLVTSTIPKFSLWFARLILLSNRLLDLCQFVQYTYHSLYFCCLHSKPVPLLKTANFRRGPKQNQFSLPATTTPEPKHPPGNRHPKAVSLHLAPPWGPRGSLILWGSGLILTGPDSWCSEPWYRDREWSRNDHGGQYSPINFFETWVCVRRSNSRSTKPSKDTAIVSDVCVFTLDICVGLFMIWGLQWCYSHLVWLKCLGCIFDRFDSWCFANNKMVNQTPESLMLFRAWCPSFEDSIDINNFSWCMICVVLLYYSIDLYFCSLRQTKAYRHRNNVTVYFRWDSLNVSLCAGVWVWTNSAGSDARWQILISVKCHIKSTLKNK